MMNHANTSVPQKQNQRGQQNQEQEREKPAESEAGNAAKESGRAREISREQGQCIPADPDPDDPVSP